MPIVPIADAQHVPTFSGFDYVTVDAARRRVYAAHTGSEALLIADADTGKVLGQVRIAPIHGVAVDPSNGHVYTGDGTDQSVSEVDPVAMKVVRETDVAGNVDAIAFDPAMGRIYADEDDGTRVFVIDAKTMKSVGTIKLPGHKPEYLAVDPKTHALYQNISDMSEFVIVDPKTLAVVATHKTPEITGNHPLQYDAALGHVVVGGQNGTLATYRTDGTLVGKTAIQDRVDQCSLDQSTHLIACAGSGTLTVLKDEADAAPSVVGTIDIPKGAHTVGIDATTGNIWIVWSQADGDYLRGFSVTK